MSVGSIQMQFLRVSTSFQVFQHSRLGARLFIEYKYEFLIAIISAWMMKLIDELNSGPWL